MRKEFYNNLKQLISYYPLPTTILAVKKNADGTPGDIYFFAVNDAFKRSFYCTFAEICEETIKYEDFDAFIEDRPYTELIPKEPKFEDIVYRAAIGGEHIHTYVDTTKLYGYWTEDIILPLNLTDDDNTGYCQFTYSLTKEMDSGMYSSVSPDISNFVVKTCLEINTDIDFQRKMDIVTKDIREFTNSFAVCMVSVDKQAQSYKIVSENLLGSMFAAKEAFEKMDYSTIECWEDLLSDTNAILIKDELDMKIYEDLAPEWVSTLRRDNVKTLCLVPFIHKGEILGYLYIVNFDSNDITRIKQTIELVAYFLSSEFATSEFKITV